MNLKPGEHDRELNKSMGFCQVNEGPARGTDGRTGSRGPCNRNLLHETLLNAPAPYKVVIVRVCAER